MVFGMNVGATQDLVMVVSDCSHPDKVNQDRVVMQTLKDICKRSSSTDPSTHPLLQNLIFVHNKSDLLSQKERFVVHQNSHDLSVFS